MHRKTTTINIRRKQMAKCSRDISTNSEILADFKKYAVITNMMQRLSK